MSTDRPTLTPTQALRALLDELDGDTDRQESSRETIAAAWEALDAEPKPARTYYTARNVGKVRHVVKFHDGHKTHRDGSRFYDLRRFSNQKDAAAFVKSLEADGYRPE